jgi:glycine/D-amino acid oxidase-like deaminating enzyme
VVRGRAIPDGDRAALDGEHLEGDAVVWACGGWLTALFPGLVTLTTTRQDLFFLDGGEPWTRAPGWVDYDGAVYGTGDLDGLGVKGAPDFEGPPLAPDAELPQADPANERWIRDYCTRRFPALATAPLKSSTTCRYELSPDSHFVAAQHPEHPAVWLLGGGSGHGFKHGPAMAERMAAALRGGEPMPERFKLGERAAGQSMRTSGSGR